MACLNPCIAHKLISRLCNRIIDRIVQQVVTFCIILTPYDCKKILITVCNELKEKFHRITRMPDEDDAKYI